jgi:hypothetical protein
VVEFVRYVLFDSGGVLRRDIIPESSLFVGDGFDAVGTDETDVLID